MNFCLICTQLLFSMSSFVKLRKNKKDVFKILKLIYFSEFKRNFIWQFVSALYLWLCDRENEIVFLNYLST